jgi:hypothetical protein
VFSAQNNNTEVENRKVEIMKNNLKGSGTIYINCVETLTIWLNKLTILLGWLA